jgi:hypothetical protein
MLTFYRKTYKRAPKGAEELKAFELGIVYPQGHPSRNGHADGAAETKAPSSAPAVASGTTATEAPTSAPTVTAKSPASDEEKARRRAESQKKLALMQQLDAAVKLRVAKGEISVPDALREAGIDPEALA